MWTTQIRATKAERGGKEEKLKGNSETLHLHRQETFLVFGFEGPEQVPARPSVRVIFERRTNYRYNSSLFIRGTVELGKCPRGAEVLFR
jgi:hypothetical protein